MKQFQNADAIMRPKCTKPWLVSDGYVKRRIAIEGIAYAEADRMYSTLAFSTKCAKVDSAIAKSTGALAPYEMLSLACPLGALEKELPEEMFVRVSRSHIVNVWAVESVRGLSLTMRGGKVIHIGKTYADVLNERFHILRLHHSEESSEGSERKSENGEKRG